VSVLKIVVTGGCGFIGSNLVERLVKKGYSVVVFDNLHTGNLENIEGLGPWKRKTYGEAILEILVNW